MDTLSATEDHNVGSTAVNSDKTETTPEVDVQNGGVKTSESDSLEAKAKNGVVN